MNAIDQLSIVTMSREQALAEFEKYKAAVKRSHDAADRIEKMVLGSILAGN